MPLALVPVKFDGNHHEFVGRANRGVPCRLRMN